MASLSSSSSLPAGYILQEGYPSTEDYLHLRSTSGLTPKNTEQATAAIAGSWYGVYVAEAASPTKAVAMGRVIGDGGWYFLVADMATLPEHQRKGIGNVIMTRLIARIKSHAPKGTAWVVLGANVPGRKLYGRHGFRDTMPSEMGMGMRLETGAGGE
ncbi:putative GNAT family N-acetyltransferase [Astrocystis sublimbata]|nr:putative GNAT family N-acetyltransferase [Astrocystis sublimbata]